MKLRRAKKILHNWQNGKCCYSNETLAKASKKFKPYFVKWCDKKNAELRERGETGIFYAPYIMQNYIKTIALSKISKKKITSRYAISVVNKDFYGEFQTE